MSTSKTAFEDYIEKLRSGEWEQVHVKKEEFLLFREVLMSQKDKEKMIGEAKKGGDVVYTYVKE